MRTAAPVTPYWPALGARVAIRDGGVPSSSASPAEDDPQVIASRVFDSERFRLVGCGRMDRCAGLLADRWPVLWRARIEGVAR